MNTEDDEIKLQIVDIIKSNWDKSKLGQYFIRNRPKWINEILPPGSHTMNMIAKNSADEILKLFK